MSQNGDVPRSWCSNVERVQGASSTLATASTRYTTSSVAGFEHVRHRVDPAERWVVDISLLPPLLLFIHPFSCRFSSSTSTSDDEFSYFSRRKRRKWRVLKFAAIIPRIIHAGGRLQVWIMCCVTYGSIRLPIRDLNLDGFSCVKFRMCICR